MRVAKRTPCLAGNSEGVVAAALTVTYSIGFVANKVAHCSRSKGDSKLEVVAKGEHTQHWPLGGCSLCSSSKNY